MPASSVEQVKERLNIVDVIGRYMKLTKSGRNYKGLSPFKKEKTPSFYVNPDKGMYYDFSSGQGGDIFTFVQAMEGVDFKGALKVLAERAGVELKPEPKGARDQRDRLYGALEDASLFFETKLAEHTEARAYLKERGLEEATMRRFRLGFAPDGWQTTRDYLLTKGYRERDLEQAGLVKKGERGSYYDRFRSRITFPLMDTAGRIVAFSGRIFGAAAEDKENAKYLNSPETELFDKGRILYGYDKAKHAIRTNDFAILVEGQMDLVLSHQAGYANTVAVSGTGLTSDHLTLIARLTQKLVLALDADSAGEASTMRAAALALPRGMDVKVARVPTGKDPADCIREDPVAWKLAIRNAEHVVLHELALLGEREHDARKLALAVRDTVLPLVARISSAVDQAHFIHRIADTLELDDESVRADVRSHARALARTDAPAPVVHAASPSVVSQLHQTSETSHPEDLERTLAGILFWQAGEDEPLLTEDYVRDRTVELGLSLGGILARYEAQRDSLALQAEVLHGEGGKIQALFDELLVRYARDKMRTERTRLSREIKDMERQGNEAELEKLLARFHALARSLEELAKTS